MAGSTSSNSPVMAIEKCEIDGVFYEKKYFQGMDHTSTRLAGALGLKVTGELWNLYLHDPATRPILASWSDKRRNSFGADLKHAYMTLRPGIVNDAFKQEMQLLICSPNQPSIGTGGVDEKSLARVTCLWFALRLIEAKPDLFPRSTLHTQPIHLDPYDMAHAYKLLSWIYRMLKGSKIPNTKPQSRAVEVPIYVRDPNAEDDESEVPGLNRSVEDLLGLTSNDAIRAMENSEALEAAEDDEGNATNCRLDMVGDITNAIYQGLSTVSQCTIARSPCDPNDRANLLWHLMEVDRFEDTCVLYEAVHTFSGEDSHGNDPAHIAVLSEVTTKRNTADSVVKEDPSGAQQHGAEAKGLALPQEANPGSSMDETLGSSDLKLAARSTPASSQILGLEDIFGIPTMVGQDIPPCSIITVEIVNPERTQHLHNQRYTHLIKEFQPKGPRTKSEATRFTSADPGHGTYSHKEAFRHSFISRINAEHDLIDRLQHYTEKDDRGFAVFYANTTFDPAVPIPSNPLLQGCYLAMDAPKLRYLFKILHDEGAFNATAASPPRFIVIANWQLVLWVIEMFLNSLSIPFVSIRQSMSEEDRKHPISYFTSPKYRCQVLLTNYNCHAKSLDLHKECSRVLFLELPLNLKRLFQAIGSVHRGGQKRRQKVWVLFQDRTFNRWLEANNTVQALPGIEAKLKDRGVKKAGSKMAEMELSRILGRSRSFSRFIKYNDLGEKYDETVVPQVITNKRGKAPLASPGKRPHNPPWPPRALPQSGKGRFSRFVRLLFGPHAGRRAHLRLWNFRHETLPAVRHRAQARLYRAIITRQTRLAETGRLRLSEVLVGRRRSRRRRGVSGLVGGLLVPFESAAREARKAPIGSGGGGGGGLVGRGSMSEYGPPSASSTWGSGIGGRERGTRRKKVFDYIKAANELRQTYAASWTAQRNASRDANEEFLNAPGAFPDVEIARSGSEEMVIFPSYARRLGRVDNNKMAEAQRERERQRRDSVDTIDEYRGGLDGQERGFPEWDMFDDENAIVAVDVRGWVYAPYRGPMTRKQRLAIALARRLTGIPAPTNNPTELDGASQDGGQIPRTTEKREEEIVDTEAQSIIKKVDNRNESGWKAAAEALDEDATLGRNLQRTPTTASVQSTQSTQSTQLSKDELSVANAHLMERIRPFLSNPMAGMAVTVFFFNDEDSQSRNITTNESGHFSLRASLPFVPTHARVLASEELSAVKEIEIIDSTGVSLISDIDDTVKHSAISSGAKEIFRNVFVRELADLTIEGVTEWYTNLAKSGVEIHYVSNAPWQLYPLLNRFFKMVGLPPGSFHLKQYSGMLQGIFEPTVERKKASLEQILQDFPERKFILVGDSGEADLEVYTDIVMANPGRIIGIFIRDITTPERTAFFDKSIDHLEHTPLQTRTPNRPSLPPRPSPRMSSDPAPDAKSAETEDLIDLSDEPAQKVSSEPEKSLNTRAPPTIPSKPSSLRSVTNTADLADRSPQTRGPIKRKPAPPLPRRHLAVESNNLSPEPVPGRSPPGNRSSTLPIRNSPVGSSEAGETSRATKQPPAPPPPRRSNTGTSMSANSPKQDTLNANLNRLPSDRPSPFPNSSTNTSRSSSPSPHPSRSPAPPSILRSPASNPSLSRTSTNNSDNYPPSRASSINSSVPPQAPLPNKREELWRRRWERASEILGERGVVLGSWRVGKDVQDVSLWLVKEAMKDARGEKSPFFGEKERQSGKENAMHS
ncbi:hypothetical protein BDW59DRAFT_179088 [Aspergillus cavernicola]|uniref:Phosphatidate phosphatase APP1 catalytic domain-containing protein n=1 Tax=Aspergillus cavernicola TaxID=176166 RepID=A0ABR4IIG9_9EURO